MANYTPDITDIYLLIDWFSILTLLTAFFRVTSLISTLEISTSFSFKVVLSRATLPGLLLDPYFFFFNLYSLVRCFLLEQLSIQLASWVHTHMQGWLATLGVEPEKAAAT